MNFVGGFSDSDSHGTCQKLFYPVVNVMRVSYAEKVNDALCEFG